MAQRTRNDKIQLTGQLTDALRGADVVFLTDFTGLNVQDMTELRRRFREAGNRFLVVKNRLALRALEELDLPDISEHLRGPTGLIIGREDAVTPAKTLRDFAKENDDRPVLKIGVVDDRLVTADEIQQLADLPPREALLASIAGGLTASVAGIAGVLNAIVRDLAVLVEEVAKKNEAGGT